MKFFTTSQIARLDQYTIENEPIEAIDLMERASLQLAAWIEAHFDAGHHIAIFAGPGNNGGDALAVSRMLAEKNYKIDVFIPDSGKKFTDSFLINLERLKKWTDVKVISWICDALLPNLVDYDLIIDGLFGSGLSRLLVGFPAQLVRHLNYSGIPIISIDIPSGLMGEDNSGNDPDAIIHAAYTLTFQFPKLSFFFRENEKFTGNWEVLPIGLHPIAIEQVSTPWRYSDFKSMVAILKPRGKFSHKGTFGHALLVAGSYGRMGAAVLAAKGCLRSGVGLLTIHIPKSGNQIVQIAVPEAMVNVDKSENLISGIPHSPNYKAIGIGPGIGKADETATALLALLENYNGPLVVDADALNLLSGNQKMIKLLPEGSILTPHPIEFERLAGHAESDFERLKLALDFAKIHRIVLILKGTYTAIILPDGTCSFNSTGNPGLATGGSGDVLTGILTGLLAQGYSSNEAALLGVYLHGLSADISVSNDCLSEESLLASDIADQLGKAFISLKNDPDFGKAKKKSQI
jgi:ADP-dependent NAD(P)H-hydrate dehydratase / NAD(P)H-hydrate epimerase